jgi:hypothetical protein
MVEAPHGERNLILLRFDVHGRSVEVSPKGLLRKGIVGFSRNPTQAGPRAYPSEEFARDERGVG